MDNLAQKIKAELENIDDVFETIPFHSELPYLSALELAGTAGLLNIFYNGIEGILKQIFLSQNITVLEGESPHEEILEAAAENDIISEECKKSLLQYLTFNQTFINTSAFDLAAEDMDPLVKNLYDVYTIFKREIGKYF